MKKFAVVAFVLLISVVQASAVVVNFDDLVGQSTVPEGYGGINWGGVWEYYGFEQPPYTPHSNPNRIYIPPPGPGEYQFTFVSPNQIFTGAWFSGEVTTSVHFNLYNDGNLVNSSNVLFTSDTPTFLSSGYAGPVDTVGVFSNANDFYVMDDVTYATVATVPEPSTMLVLASGLIGLVGYGRKKFFKK